MRIMTERELNIDQQHAKDAWTPGGELVNQLQKVSVLVGMLEIKETLVSQDSIDTAISEYRAKYGEHGKGNAEIITLLESEWNKENLDEKYLQLNKLIYAERDGR